MRCDEARQYFLAIISLREKHINQYLLENNVYISRSCVWSNNKTMQAFTSRRKKRNRVGKYPLYELEIIKTSSNKIIQLNLNDFAPRSVSLRDRVYPLITKSNYYPESEENKILYASISFKCQQLTKQ